MSTLREVGSRVLRNALHYFCKPDITTKWKVKKKIFFQTYLVSEVCPWAHHRKFMIKTARGLRCGPNFNPPKKQNLQNQAACTIRLTTNTYKYPPCPAVTEPGMPSCLSFEVKQCPLPEVFFKNPDTPQIGNINSLTAFMKSPFCVCEKRPRTTWGPRVVRNGIEGEEQIKEKYPQQGQLSLISTFFWGPTVPGTTVLMGLTLREISTCFRLQTSLLLDLNSSLFQV